MTWFDAIGESLVGFLRHPVASYGNLPRDGSLKPALLFAALIGGQALAWQALWSLVFPDAVSFAGDRAQSALILAVGAPFFSLTSLFFEASIFHLGLRMVGSASGGFRSTLRAAAYAQAPLILAVIPAAGGSIGALWGLVLFFVGLKTLHGASIPRIIGGLFLVSMVLALLVGLAAAVALIGGLSSLLPSLG